MIDKRYIDKFALKYTKMVKVCEHLYGNLHPSDVVGMLRSQGMHQSQIAVHLGVSLSAIRQWQRPEAGGVIYDDEHRERVRKTMIALNERIRRGEVRMRSPWRNQRLFAGSK